MLADRADNDLTYRRAAKLDNQKRAAALALAALIVLDACRVEAVQSDGNCLFRTVQDQQGMCPEEHMESYWRLVGGCKVASCELGAVPKKCPGTAAVPDQSGGSAPPECST